MGKETGKYPGYNDYGDQGRNSIMMCLHWWPDWLE